MWIWSRAREECGYVDALNEFFRERLKSDARLQLAVTQIEVAQAAIDNIMENDETEA